MPDVWMTWFHMGHPKPDLTRTGLRRLCRDLGVEVPEVRDGKVAAFTQACQVRHVYEDEGVIHTLSASVVKVTLEMVTAHVVREDGFKMAEYKFLKGRLIGTRLRSEPAVKAQIRARLSPLDRQAAKAWVVKADEMIAVVEERVSEVQVRRYVTAAMEQVGWPVPLRPRSYFIYEDELDVVRRVRAFLAATMQEGEMVAVGLDDGDRTLTAHSADLFLLPQAQAITTGLSQLSEHDDPKVVELQERLRVLRRQYRRHERRLEVSLPLTGQEVTLADRLITAMIRAATLPYAYSH